MTFDNDEATHAMNAAVDMVKASASKMSVVQRTRFAFAIAGMVVKKSDDFDEEDRVKAIDQLAAIGALDFARFVQKDNEKDGDPPSKRNPWESEPGKN